MREDVSQVELVTRIYQLDGSKLRGYVNSLLTNEADNYGLSRKNSGNAKACYCSYFDLVSKSQDKHQTH